MDNLSKPNEYKDGMFRALFNNEDKALQLYSAITGKKFNKDTKVELKTLENVLLSKARNDLAFTVDDVLIVIIENQSTLNMNMPLRSLEYVLLFIELFYSIGKTIYKDKRILLPKPEFYMLYNGTKPYPATGVMKLSDSFLGLKEDESPALELIVNVININYGFNTDMLECNQDLKGYVAFVEKVRSSIAKGETLQESIKRSMDECVNEGILVDFFSQYKNEVDSMFSLVYDEEKALEVAREEAWEDGQIVLIERMLLKGRSAEAIADDTDIPLEKIAFIKNKMAK
jgi:hypothetical protein